MELQKLFCLLIMILLSVMSANAVLISEPVNNFHYDSENILFNATNLNDTDGTYCNMTYNTEDANFELLAGETYSYYLGDIQPTNVISYDCADLSYGDIVFYYDAPSTATETDATFSILAVLSFIALAVLIVLVFRLR